MISFKINYRDSFSRSNTLKIILNHFLNKKRIISNHDFDLLNTKMNIKKGLHSSNQETTINVFVDRTRCVSHKNAKSTYLTNTMESKCLFVSSDRDMVLNNASLRIFLGFKIHLHNNPLRTTGSLKGEQHSSQI